MSLHRVQMDNITFYLSCIVVVCSKLPVHILRLVLRNTLIMLCIRKVAVDLQKLVEVMSTGVYTGLNPLTFLKPSAFFTYQA
jgi:hypothetical protein